MRTLSSTLTASQKTLTYSPIWKVVLSRTSQTTKGYDMNRVMAIAHSEVVDSYKADFTIINTTNDLTTLDFEHYQAVISYGMKTGVSRTAWVAGTAYALDDVVVPTTANGYQYRCAVAGNSHAATEPTWPTDLGVRVTDNTVTWEMDGNTGDEYSRTAPLRVRAQELHSGRGILRCILHAAGIPDQMAEDKALSEYTQLSTDTNTVQTLLTAIAGATLTPYTTYEAFTVTYDSTDSLIGTFIPADYFRVSVNDNRWDKFKELLSYTGCKCKIGNDGAIHVLDPVTTGTTYAYEYKFNVAGDHTFFDKTVSNRFVNPNKEIISSHPDQGTYTGSATSAASYALSPKTHTSYKRLTSDAQAASIASAIIERYELDAEKGIASVPINVGQELWDYVKVTDSREGDTRIGNIQYINRIINLKTKPPIYMSLSFGKVLEQSLMLLSTDGFDNTSGGSSNNYLQMIQTLYENQKLLFDIVNRQSNDIWLAFEYINNLDEWINDAQNMLTLKRLIVTEQLVIPAWP